MVRVAQINPHLDSLGRSPRQLLRDWPTLARCASAASQAGARVTVLQRSEQREHLALDGVDYHFLPFDDIGAFGQLLRGLAPEVLHLQGLGFAREMGQLAKLVPDVPLLVQDHAARPPNRPWIWWRWRRSLALARGLMFCAREQARPFEQRGLLAPHTRIYEVPESSSGFRPIDAAEARRATGLAGSPVLLWVAHLDENKDPLTVLEGVARAVERLPELKLTMCFGKAPLYEVVCERLRDPRLAGRVHLRGQVDHEEVERLMSAADFLVQGSHREGSGYSLIEALACGLSPVVTDIPSFRTLLGPLATTRAARLWPCGNPQALAQALVELAEEPVSARRSAVRARFDEHCSPEALGRCLVSVYEDALSA
ncbi:glycosyltransferase family 4 protein [Roseateles saccharophilus]|uniref:Glycosyltransferase involved in cell wall biosynthesis n=1 Tax=Roseateles saccharophilus TaxID=304 RepID=A0A4R3UN30_ROSSA|nr:glycosyltransferase family 4 protein [Roseateles saccharophilus]MDG0833461.1 glycosyltransferase [Roseateles saccharophilus]TCU93116.1 glycosyltransferase involved in cell wall biosynthesis [Roseateles saccharophilus]